MKIRLDKLLGNLGYGSRSQLKKELKTGIVTVNNNIEKDGSLIVDPDIDEIYYNKERVEYIQYIYLMMNKPQGVISATEDYYRDTTVIDLLDDKYKCFAPFPVGRLDKNTEGLLLLTNNGKLAHNMLSPKKHVDKTYFVNVKGVLDQKDIDAFENGIMLSAVVDSREDDFVTMPAKLKILKADQISEALVTIKEGKFHQIKRMFEALDKKVVYLKRLSMGPIKLDEKLAVGEYRELKETEIKLLEPYMQK